MELLTQLATMALKAEVQFLVETCQLTQTNDGGIVGTNHAEAMLISPQGIGQYKSVPPVILGAGRKISITETIELFRIDGIDAEPPLEQLFDQSAMWQLDRNGH
jgi:hypothetical protein